MEYVLENLTDISFETILSRTELTEIYFNDRLVWEAGVPGYIILDFIQSSGTQWIDTGITDFGVVVMEADISYTSINTSQVIGITGNAGGGIGVSGNNWWSVTSSAKCSSNTRYTLRYEKNDVTYRNSVNGEILGYTTHAIGSTGLSMMLFASRSSVTATTTIANYNKAKLYGCKIWKNGELVREFIPVYSIQTGKCGLWDKVTKTFYGNKGTGDFAGYIPVDYIESSGVQFINTESAYSSISNIKGKFEHLGPEGDGVLFGQDYIFVCANSVAYTYGSGYSSNTRIEPNRVYEIEVNNTADQIQTLSIDGQVVETTNFPVNSTSPRNIARPAFLFCRNGGTTSNLAETHIKARVYYWMIEQNRNLVKDFRPHYDILNKKFGMLDKLKDIWYGNVSGTGEFGGGISDRNIVPLEYLESTGTQWIDTGWVLDGEYSRVQMKFTQDGDTSSSTRSMFGAAQSATQSQYGIAFRMNQSKDWLSVGANWGVESTFPMPKNTIFEFDAIADNGTWTLNANGNTYSGTYSGTLGKSYSQCVFASKFGGSMGEYGIGRVYYLKIYNKDGVLVRDYIPCYYKLTNQVGLYDKIGKKVYGNNGTGDFKYGMYEKDITELKYIGSTGTQNIDTGINADNTMEIETDFYLPEYQDFNIFGTDDSSYRVCSGYYGAGSNWAVSWNNVLTTNAGGKIGDNHIKIGKGQADINGTVTTINQNSYTSSQTIRAFGNSTKPCNKRLYTFKIWKNDVLVRDLIPARNNLFGDVGLYDKVEHKFYTNSGTGKFIYGLKKYTILNSITSTGTQYINTGVTSKSGIRVLVDASTDNDNIFYGTVHNQVGGGCWFGKTVADFWGCTYTNARYAMTLAKNTRYLIDQSWGSYLDINGRGQASFSNAGASSSGPFYLFTAYDIYNGSLDPHSFTLFSCKIFESGVKTRDFVPCKTSWGEIGLLDLVSEGFFPNNGTGSFVSDDIGADNIVPLRYIESTGTQYIATRVSVPHESEKIVARMLSLDAAQDAPFSGHSYGSWSWTTNMFYMTQNKFAWGRNAWTAAEANRIYDVEYTSSYLKIDGEQIASNPSSYTNGYMNTIFYANGEYGKYRLYSFKLYDGDKLVRDFVPCFCRSANAIGLYDDVEGRFYANYGSGNFNYGLYEEYVQKLDYIESTGTQWISTEYVPNTNTALELEFTLTKQPTGDACVIGQRSASYNQNGNYGFWATSNGSFNNCTFDYNGVNFIPQVLSVGTKSRLSLDKNKVYFNGELVFEKPMVEYSANRPIVVCAQNTSGTIGYNSNIKIYHLKIYNDGVLVREFIPGYDPFGDSIGLYDKVTGIFCKNGGSGVFLFNSDLTEDEITKVQYVESSGSQYIDTEFKPTGNSEFDIDFYVNASSGNGIFGEDTSWLVKNFCLFRDRKFVYGSQTASPSATTYYADKNRYHVEVKDSILWINGEYHYTFNKEDFNADYNATVFAKVRGSAIESYSSIRLYSLKLWDNGSIIRDFIPCKVYGVYGLYDLVEHKFYSNKGSGSFVGG